jgi:RNAse H-fold protein YqgF
MKVVGLDVGDVRIGIAVSDILGMCANPRESYIRKNDEDDFKYFTALAKAEGADTFVVGLPINMDGTEGKRVEVTRDFAERLRAFSGMNIVYQDERLSTVSAEKMLIEGNVRREKRKKVIDKVAACIILQSYLDKI